MSIHNDLGKKGEEIAVNYLKNLGYVILETNWYCGKNEIDIIADYKDSIVFIEVKTRSSNYFGTPESFVTKNKQKYVIKAANKYLDLIEDIKEVRFDVISVLYNKEIVTIKHIENAFYPTL